MSAVGKNRLTASRRRQCFIDSPTPTVLQSNEERVRCDNALMQTYCMYVGIVYAMVSNIT
ncbi:hypothetical protein Pla100_40360 [Neorhodopirellula pilleata]|uniref:Uncharacterized protein n=1 Tax=Neorhodopirellula pilleata TaxID=2714738 RepID=A0A5C6A2P3_9BACT|nr:hypothetical protein Pla100_40360 [Neorhodopirellula pilleata]